MVQFKKSPIEPFEPVRNYPNDAQVWVIEATGEVFGTYDGYLRKLDYYRQKLFSCEITGHRHMTFFEALKSEKLGMREIDSIFPDQLRGPLLRKVQFSTIPRTDELVNHLYDIFKEDFYPGELVSIDDPETGLRISGRIGEKQQILSASQNSKESPSARYYVHVSGKPSREVMVTNKEVFRDRRSFTKQVLRSFLKHTIYRERFDGSPWQVKEEIAKRYKIDTKVPPHLTVDAILAQRKAAKGLKHTKDIGHRGRDPGYATVTDLATQIRNHKGKLPADLVLRFHAALETCKDPVGAALIGIPGSGGKRDKPREKPPAKMKKIAPPPPPREKTPPPPPPKYPIEDLDVEPKLGATPRPTLKSLPEGMPSLNYPESSQTIEDIERDSVGILLEIWNTLNVHASYFVLDSFTIDDLVDAMLFSSEDVSCELFSEIHCAVLQTLVNTDGEPDANIPMLSSSSESSSAETSVATTPEPEEPGPMTRRKSKRVSGADTDLAQADATKMNGIVNGHTPHNAREMLQDYDWMDRIKDRDFARGGWQVIMVGLLEHMTLTDEEENSKFQKILSELAPEDQPATRETAQKQYATLDVNLRVAALEMALMLSVTSRSFKEALESRNDQQTTDRRVKVEAQRRKKPLILELQELDTQRKLQRPEPLQENSEVSGPGTPMEVDAEESIKAEADEDSEDDLPRRYRTLRKTTGRANDLKRKREEEERIEKEKKAKLEEANMTPEERQYRKILQDIEKKKDEIKQCEDEVAEAEEKLRESACHRTRSLGKDRFFNRYWWFERNGMPYGGQEASSTAHYGYANGRLWVQGPDDLEQGGLFDQTEQESRQYRLQMGMTVNERRKKEEGASTLVSAREWGYYSTPQELDELMTWLDDRGNRERELLKELQIWRDKIAEYMDAMNSHVQEAEEKKAELDERVVGIATRKKTHVDNNTTKYPCLAWTNTLALQEFGHLHSDGPPPKKMRGGGRGTKDKPKEKKIALPAKRETRRGTRF